MAIDNLYFRANENTFRLKYEFDEKGSVERKEVKLKKDEMGKNDEDSTYEQRSKHSVNKLKNIISHMKDIKAIIDEYKATYKHGGGKMEKY